MSLFDDDDDVMRRFRSCEGASAPADDVATFDAARALVRAGMPVLPPAANVDLASLLREGTPRRSRMNPLAKVAGLGLAGKLALAGGVALAASAGGLTVAGIATSGNSHAAAGLATAGADHGAPDHATPAVTDPTSSATPSNHGTCVSAVARATPEPSDSPNAHGQAVSAVAQSDCDKPASSGQGKPTSLPSQANAHASDHLSGKPSSLPPSHPTGKPSSLPPSHPTGAPTAPTGH
jgi:hypothetical protein